MYLCPIYRAVHREVNHGFDSGRARVARLPSARMTMLDVRDKRDRRALSGLPYLAAIRQLRDWIIYSALRVVSCSIMLCRSWVVGSLCNEEPWNPAKAG
jgi:hypothetical protein